MARKGRRRSDKNGEPAVPRVRLLAVDDDPTYLAYLRLTLTRHGFDVDLAGDGRSAVARVRQNNEIALVLVDLAMPSMDGFATMRKLRREIDRDLYTILLTAHDEVDTKLRALDSGFDDFLSKQATESEIVAKLRSAVRRLEMERSLKLQNQQLETLALTDDLTGIANRRGLFRAAGQIAAEKRTLSVALFDLDHFKRINDTYGHRAGDRILADVATSLKANTRYGDIIGRYGGDEFVLLLPETGEEEAKEIVNRLAAKIAQLQWSFHDTPVTITTCVGVSSGTVGVADLLEECDRLLYRSKRAASEHPPKQQATQ
ncbi:MAG: GGDEF domain-containing protein [Thermoanaerobaculia bacterium]